MEDERVNRFKTEAKFRNVPKKSRKVKIDKRFQSMFKDEQFKESYSIDKRGRPIKHSSDKDLRRYYHLSSSDESSSEDEKESQAEDLGKNQTGDKNVSDEIKKKLKNLKVDYARGEQTLLESSSDDEESEEEYEEEDTIEHKWGELDADAEKTDTVTNRLAICNMDWDRITAVDIMVLLNSFLPPGGVIESVKIYVSEFGKKRLVEEDISGPPELRETKLDDEDEETEEGSKYHMEKLRQYQLNRLKYYYAVVTFNNESAANKVYTECDGMEYESSAVRLDLRIIPNDMEFEDEPKDSCEEMPTKYQPKYFTTSALQQAKVHLTWDETNPDRIDLAQKINSGKLDDLDDDLLRNFVASSEDESEDENREKYSTLLKEIENEGKQEEDDDVELEATWDIGLEEKSKEPVEKEDKTPFQQYLDKRKEKRKQKKKLKKQENDDKLEDSDIPSDIDMNDPYFAEEFNKPEFTKKKDKKHQREKIESDEEKDNNEAELQLLLANEETDGKNHFSLKKIQEKEDKSKKSKKNKKKKKNGQQEIMENDGFKLNVEDPRFSAVFSSHLYSIDPSNPHYKKTEAMETIIKEKLKRSSEVDDEVVSKKSKMDESKRMNTELGVLVKNLKRKTKEMLKNK
ncbi:ESF1 homolog [Coccinella septempunctata]|uniref:ESF1 homolog n=1 Tax=Coccinella septempunctata TaxID=41139 RepID=UPI001D085180|nr:ESF1 homolog [Coccinella septempunctata]